MAVARRLAELQREALCGSMVEDPSTRASRENGLSPPLGLTEKVTTRPQVRLDRAPVHRPSEWPTISVSVCGSARSQARAAANAGAIPAMTEVRQTPSTQIALVAFTMKTPSAMKGLAHLWTVI